MDHNDVVELHETSAWGTYMDDEEKRYIRGLYRCRVYGELGVTDKVFKATVSTQNISCGHTLSTSIEYPCSSAVMDSRVRTDLQWRMSKRVGRCTLDVTVTQAG